MDNDVKQYVTACSVCACNKNNNQPPAGLLLPLSSPRHLWSHIALDFVTCLPVSEGYSAVFTIVHCFSKAAHFIPLPKLPSASETAQIEIKHVFHLHGTPLDIVSDRGPQFTSQVWNAFCQALGATASLMSGYHPQSNNGQTKQGNQELEAALRSVIENNPITCSQHLPWVEYAHNSQT